MSHEAHDMKHTFDVTRLRHQFEYGKELLKTVITNFSKGVTRLVIIVKHLGLYEGSSFCCSSALCLFFSCFSYLMVDNGSETYNIKVILTSLIFNCQKYTIA